MTSRHVEVDVVGGIAGVRLHSGGDSLAHPVMAAAELSAVFAALDRDPDVKVIVVTGSGDRFADRPSKDDQYDPAATLLNLYRDFLDLRMPVIAAVNGPVRGLAPLVWLADIVLLADTATIQDDRLPTLGVAPLDGAQSVWLDAIGPIRAKYHLFTGAPIAPGEALRIGAASEVVAAGELSARASALAKELASRPATTLRFAREVLVRHRRRLITDDGLLGWALSLSTAKADQTAALPAVPPPPGPSRYEQVSVSRVEGGVVQLTMHSGDGSWRFRSSVFRDLHLAYMDVAAMADVQSVVITGAGDAFVREGDVSEVVPVLGHMHPADGDYFYENGRRTLLRQFRIPVPIVLAVNGPALVHAEFFLGADVVLAADTASFADTNHLPIGVAIGGSGILWESVLRSARAKDFIFGQRALTASQALDLGVVNEVLPADQLHDRALEHARRLAALPPARRPGDPSGLGSANDSPAGRRIPAQHRATGHVTARAHDTAERRRSLHLSRTTRGLNCDITDSRKLRRSLLSPRNVPRRRRRRPHHHLAHRRRLVGDGRDRARPARTGVPGHRR
ncbi:enoyl-CoA hydratase/isomerase family protein [Mycobacterium sp.]|uniref:enoyl-CoA hydratase/isomerase family protein n=1 Tax=Mycobacterium sp. TaxID=1785 RepID=UPI00257DC86A|nr:enoyl-CoA hydratase/isomerase family protein [Mycobacterium sp.]